MTSTRVQDRDGGVYDKSHWYSEDPPKLSDSTRQLLEEYSKIPSDQVVSHVSAIREKAWSIHPYPCIGQWRFLDLSLGNHALYPEVLDRLRSGSQTILDLGCAFGQDIRRLVFDGADGAQCYGSDLQLDFLDLGYELFRDKATLGAKFLQADIFDPSSPLSQLDGKVDIIHAASFFHLFSREDQKHIARRVVQLLRPLNDSLLLGRQMASREPGEVAKMTGEGKQANATHYRHDEKSWQLFWQEIGEEAGGIRFDVKVAMRDRVMPNGSKMPQMEYSVRRL